MKVLSRLVLGVLLSLVVVACGSGPKEVLDEFEKLVDKMCACPEEDDTCRFELDNEIDIFAEGQKNKEVSDAEKKQFEARAEAIETKREACELPPSLREAKESRKYETKKP